MRSSSAGCRRPGIDARGAVPRARARCRRRCGSSWLMKVCADGPLTCPRSARDALAREEGRQLARPACARPPRSRAAPSCTSNGRRSGRPASAAATLFDDRRSPRARCAATVSRPPGCCASRLQQRLRPGAHGLETTARGSAGCFSSTMREASAPLRQAEGPGAHGVGHQVVGVSLHHLARNGATSSSRADAAAAKRGEGAASTQFEAGSDRARAGRVLPRHKGRASCSSAPDARSSLSPRIFSFSKR